MFENPGVKYDKIQYNFLLVFLYPQNFDSCFMQTTHTFPKKNFPSFTSLIITLRNGSSLLKTLLDFIFG